MNGKILVPLPEERVPFADDPQTNQIIAAMLKAYPAEKPNLPKVTPRHLNTNAERDIESEDWTLKLDYLASDQDSLTFQYTLTDYSETPFELVVGKNPQSDLRPQSFSATHVHTFSPATLFQSSLHFDRFRGLLLPTENHSSLLESVGLADVPEITLGGDLTRIGPGGPIPRRRFRNRFSGHQFGFDLSGPLIKNRLFFSTGISPI